MKKIWLTHSIVLCFLLSLIAVGVYAGISSEVGTYVWDTTNSRWTKHTGTSSGATTIGNKTPSDTYANPTTAVDSVGLTMGFDPQDSLWKRIVSVPLDQATWPSGGITSKAAMGTASFLFGINGAGWWEQLKTTGTGTNLTTGVLVTGLYGYDSVGANWDRANIDTSGNMQVRAIKEKASSVTTESSAANNCTGTTASLISSNAGRLELMILNTAPVDAYICFAATCTTTTGMRLQENMSITNEHYTGAVSCITASGNTTVAVKEL